MAPEVMEQVWGYDFKVDIWSFGITAIELATGVPPYHKHPPTKVLMLTLKNDLPVLETGITNKGIVKKYGKSFRKMIALCLQKDPEKRPASSELLKHKFFQKSKTRKYILDKLLPRAPTITERSKSVRGEPEFISQLYKKEDDELDEKSKRGTAALGAFSSPRVREGSQNSEVSQTPDLLGGWPQEVAARQPDLPVKPPSANSQAPPQSTPPTSATSGDSKAPTSFVLRLRNSKKEIKDIYFEFRPMTDTAEGVSQELVAAAWWMEGI